MTSTILSPGLQLADAMHDEARLQRPARLRLGLDARPARPRSCRDSARASSRRRRPSSAAHPAGEGDDGADVGVGRRSERQSRRRRRSPPAARGRPWLSLRSPAGRRRSRARRQCARVGLDVHLVEGGADDLRARERLVVFGPARASASRRDRRRSRRPRGSSSILGAAADLFAHPGKIEKLHACLPRSRSCAL